MKNHIYLVLVIFTATAFAFGQTNSEKTSNFVDNDGGINRGEISPVTRITDPPATVKKAIAPRAAELNNQAVNLASRKDYRKALELFRQADALDPYNEQILFNLGMTFLNMRLDEKAAAVFRKVIEISPANANAYDSLGLVLFNLGETDASFSAFRRSLQISPNDAVTLCNFANSLLHAGEQTAALEVVNRALKLLNSAAGETSIVAAAYNIRGSILFNRKKYGEAQTDFESAIKLNPSNAEAINNLGVVYSRAGKKKKAVKYFLAAERLAPDWSIVLYNLVLNFSAAGDKVKSRQYLIKLETGDPALAVELKKALIRKYVVDVSKMK